MTKGVKRLHSQQGSHLLEPRIWDAVAGCFAIRYTTWIPISCKSVAGASDAVTGVRLACLQRKEEVGRGGVVASLFSCLYSRRTGSPLNELEVDRGYA
jgi:hypothetical protein